MLKNYSKIEVDVYGTKRYLNDKGKHHRLDGSAVEYINGGSKYWLINGNSHRNIDPSEEWSNGEKYWFFNNKRHRVGSYSFREILFIHGRRYTKKGYFNKVWKI